MSRAWCPRFRVSSQAALIAACRAAGQRPVLDWLDTPSCFAGPAGERHAQLLRPFSRRLGDHGDVIVTDPAGTAARLPRTEGRIRLGRRLPGSCRCARWVWSRSARPGWAGRAASRGPALLRGDGGRGVPGCIRRYAHRGGEPRCGPGRTGGPGGRSRGRHTVADAPGSGAAATAAAYSGRTPAGGYIRRFPATAAEHPPPRQRYLSGAARAGRALGGSNRERWGGHGRRSR